MTTKQAWDAGMTSWLDLTTTDVAGAKSFYGELLGWTSTESPMPGDMPGTYTMIHLGDGNLGGVNELQAEQKSAGMPPSWSVYFAVEDVDETVAAAKKAGGKVIQDAFDIPETGRMAVLSDPTGAVFSVWGRHSPHIGADRFENKPGSFCWAELGTNNIDVAGGFYTKIFPYKADMQPMGEMGDYTTFKVGEEPAAGMYKLPPEMAKVPPHWLPYFVTEDIDASTVKAEKLGGQKVCPIGEAPGVGRIVILKDPQGANFALLEPAPAA